MENKKPSMFVAILFTVSATCSLMSLALMATGKTSGSGLVIFQFVTVGLLTFSAIANWVIYFKKYVNHKVESQLSEKSGERIL